MRPRFGLAPAALAIASLVIGAFGPFVASAHAQPGYYPYPYPYRDPYLYRYAGPESDVRITVTPKDAAVYVDGYFAGHVDDYDGVFQRLHVAPGQHEIVIALERYRSLHEKVYLSPNATRKIDGKLEPLAAGEPDDPLPTPPPPPPPPAGTDSRAQPPRRVRPYGRPGPADDPRQPPPEQAPAATSSTTSGTVSFRVQPGDADILIDGERWNGPSGEDERLIVQLSEGRHTVEVRKRGYRVFSTDVDVRPGETTPVNVSLSPDR